MDSRDTVKFSAHGDGICYSLRVALLSCVCGGYVLQIFGATRVTHSDRYARAVWEAGRSCRWMVTGWLVRLGQARGGSGASRSRVGGAFGEGESSGARRRRSRWGPLVLSCTVRILMSYVLCVWAVRPEGEVGTRDWAARTGL